MNTDYNCDTDKIPMVEIEIKQISRNLIIRNFRCPICGKEKKLLEYGGA